MTFRRLDVTFPGEGDLQVAGDGYRRAFFIDGNIVWKFFIGNLLVTEKLDLFDNNLFEGFFLKV